MILPFVHRDAILNQNSIVAGRCSELCPTVQSAQPSLNSRTRSEDHQKMLVKLPIINHIVAVSSLHRDDLPLQQIVFLVSIH